MKLFFSRKVLELRLRLNFIPELYLFRERKPNLFLSRAKAYPKTPKDSPGFISTRALYTSVWFEPTAVST